MSISKKQAEEVSKIAAEVVVLAAEVSKEIDGLGQYGTPSGIKTGALRRRSMDLTRALAVMRGAN